MAIKMHFTVRCGNFWVTEKGLKFTVHIIFSCFTVGVMVSVAVEDRKGDA